MQTAHQALNISIPATAIVAVSATGPAVPPREPDSAGSDSAAWNEPPEMSALAALVMRVFRENADHRRNSGVDDALMTAMLAYRSQYSEQEKARLKASKVSSGIYAPITATKIRAAASQLHELVGGAGDKPWTLAPTPVPDVPEYVKAQALRQIVKDFVEYVRATGRVPEEREVRSYADARMDEVRRREREWAITRAERMERLVHDQMCEGGFVEEFGRFVDDLCIYGTAAMVGPVPRVTVSTVAHELPGGATGYAVENRLGLAFEAVDPWDLYPSSGAVEARDGFLCIRVRYTTDALWRFCHVADAGEEDAPELGEWRADAIREVLAAHPSGGVRLEEQSMDFRRRTLQFDVDDLATGCMCEGVEFFGDVRGSMLREIGVDRTSAGDAVRDEEFYEVDAVVIDGRVVFCRLVDPEVGRPVSKCRFYEIPGSWWGDSIAARCDTTQRVANAALRSLDRNMAMASGPMVFIKDAQRLVRDGTEADGFIRPWRTVSFNAGYGGGYGQTDNPIGVLQFPTMANELLAVFNWAAQRADEDTGIPAYTYGNMQGMGGALRTSSGLSMSSEAASRVIKMVAVGIDRDCIRDLVRRTVDWNMVHGTDLSVKGDVKVVPAGVMGLILREAESQRRKQAASMLANPAMMQVFGQEPLVEIMREEFKSLGVPNVDDMLPSKEKMRLAALMDEIARMRQLEAGPEGGAPEGADSGPVRVRGLPAPGGSDNPQRDTALARVLGDPSQVAMSQGLPSAGSGVRERRAVA